MIEIFTLTPAADNSIFSWKFLFPHDVHMTFFMSTVFSNSYVYCMRYNQFKKSMSN